jgi:hypothetical protein
MSLDSSARIVTGYGVGGRGSIPCRERDFHPLDSVHTGSGAYPASYPVSTAASFPGLERPECEAEHSPSSVEVKNGGAIPPLPHTAALCCVRLIKNRAKFTFAFLGRMKTTKIPVLCSVSLLRFEPYTIRIPWLYHRRLWSLKYCSQAFLYCGIDVVNIL